MAMRTLTLRHHMYIYDMLRTLLRRRFKLTCWHLCFISFGRGNCEFTDYSEILTSCWHISSQADFVHFVPLCLNINSQIEKLAHLSLLLANVKNLNNTMIYINHTSTYATITCISLLACYLGIVWSYCLKLSSFN